MLAATGPSGSLDVVGICGSLRKASYNRMALQVAGELMPDVMRLDIVEIRDLPMYDWDLQQAGFPDTVSALRRRVEQADAVLFAVPEYNGAAPAVLKNAIDWLSRFRPTPVFSKPCAILSASMGLLGGARVQYEFRKVLAHLNALTMLNPEVFIGMAHEKFDAAGQLVDPASREFVRNQMIAFQKWIVGVKLAFPPVAPPQEAA